MSEIELKACPFCGLKPVMRERSGDERNGYNTSLELDCKCGASIETKTKNNGGLPTENVASAKRRLRDAWNTRAPKWQPIETAPKDGTRLLLLGDGDMVVAYFNVGYGTWDDGDHHDDIQGLTHWQQLPAAPEVSR